MEARVVHADDVGPERLVLDESSFGLRLLTAPAEHRCAGHDDLLFVLTGRGALRAGAAEHELAPGTAAFAPRGVTYRLEGDLQAVAVSVHDPDTPAAPEATVVRLADRHADPATANRSFRVLCDPGSATQFVGFIPAETAPDHYHLYDEVIYVLDGQGVVRMPGIEAPLRPGSCRPPLSVTARSAAPSTISSPLRSPPADPRGAGARPTDGEAVGGPAAAKAGPQVVSAAG